MKNYRYSQKYLFDKQTRKYTCVIILLAFFAAKNVMAQSSEQQQDFTVSGNVTDASDNSVLPGVNISVKGTTTGTSSSADGSYSLTVPSPQDTLVFSFIGYQTQEVPINGRTQIDISLQSQAITGDEMVVVGYGQQKKANLTESASQIDGAQLAERPTVNLSQSLQGNLPGLNITNDNGNPASEPDLNIRGFTSINGGSPLVLIDGVEGDINEINPQDVESVTVLKDASASAIYGARAAFGVVLVTTKTPGSGEAQISYSNNFGWQTATTNKDFITDPYQAAQLIDQAFQISTGNSYTGYSEQDYQELQRRSEDPSLPDVVVQNRNGRDQYVYYGNTDWWDYITKEYSPAQIHNLSVSGGNENFQVRLSGRFYENEKMLEIQDDSYTTYNGRSSVNFKVNEWLTLSNNTYLNQNNEITHGGALYGYFDPWGALFYVHALPSYVPQNPDGTATFRTELNNYTIGDGTYATLQQGTSREIINQRELGNKLEATIIPLENLELVANYTTRVEYYNETQRSTRAPWSIYPGEIDYLGNDQLLEVRGQDTYSALNVFGRYAYNFGNHNLRGVTGLNRERARFESIDASKRNSISNRLNALDLASSDAQAFGNASEWSLLGFFYRVNYEYDNRYLLEINGRYDGTSRFPEEDRWGFFPSISGGWLISNENFFSGLDETISQLKLRASYGSLGNQQVATYAYTPTLTKGTADYLINGNLLEYISPPGLNPRSITWEEVNTINLGMDLGLLSDKITANIDFYQRSTLGMLTQGQTLPAVLGTGSPQENAADLQTRGFEVQLGYQNTIQMGGKPLNFAINANLSNSKTEITRFDNPNNFLGDYYEGQTIGEVWGYHVSGLFASDEEAANHADQTRVNGRINSSPGEFGQVRAGDVKFTDLNGDGVIDEGDNTLENPGDRRKIGNEAPQFPYSFSLRTDWNNIDFSVFFQGVGKQDWYPSSNSRLFWAMYNQPYASFIRKDLVNDIWSSENTDAYFPRLRGYITGGSLGAVNDRYLQDASYLRMKNITIGFTLPQSWVQNIVSRVRIYVSGENLLTFSPLSDYIDPEAATNGINLSQPSNNNSFSPATTYPFSKIYSFGVNLDF